MKLIIDIPEDVYTRLFDNGIQDNEIAVDDVCEMARALRLGTPQETVTEFADRCRECGARYGKKLKRYIEKDIEMLNEIIESGWLISDYDKCTAIDACEDAIKALKQYSVLDKIRAEIIDKYMTATGEVNTVAKGCLQIIDKYKAESEEV